MGRVSGFERFAFISGVGMLAAGALIAGATPALAAFPSGPGGGNGDIAFVSTRNNAVAIDQVNPNASNLGTSSGDQSATTALTNGSVDSEPFYSPDGQT